MASAAQLPWHNSSRACIYSSNLGVYSSNLGVYSSNLGVYWIYCVSQHPRSGQRYVSLSWHSRFEDTCGPGLHSRRCDARADRVHFAVALPTFRPSSGGAVLHLHLACPVDSRLLGGARQLHWRTRASAVHEGTIRLIAAVAMLSPLGALDACGSCQSCSIA